MGLFVNQENTRTKLQERIAADLAEKSKKKALIADQDRPDGVEDSQYIKGTKQTTSRAWVWLLIVAAVVAISVILIFRARG
jgi:Flp pilus assembly protein TadB